MKLDAAGCFSNIPDNYLFVFNYTNIVTEMDIVTILSEKNKDDVFIDIEVKNQDSDDVFRKMENQLNNRIDAQMPKFLKTVDIFSHYIFIALSIFFSIFCTSTT